MNPRNKFAILALCLALLLPLTFGSVVSAEPSQQVGFSSPTLVVNTSFLNVRTGPGVQYGVLITVVGGTELPVLAVASDGVWYQVATDAGPGWVNVEFTLPRGTFTNVPVASAETTTPTNTSAGQGGGSVQNAAPIAISEFPLQGIVLLGSDLRSEPSDSAPNVRSALPADPNTVYPILNQTTVNQENWYFINVPGAGQGWVNKAEFRLLECGTNDVVVTSFPVTMIFDGISDDTPFTVEPGTEGFARGFQGPFLLFEIFGVATGLIPSDAFENRNGVESLCGDAPIVNSAPVDVSAGQGGGAVAQPQAVTGNRAVVNVGNLNVRSGPGAEYSVLAVAPGGLELAVIGRAPDDVWLLVSGSFGQGWVNTELILFRGAYTTVPLIADAYNQAAPSAGQGGGTVVQGQTVTGNRLIINAGNLNVRSGPSVGYSVITSLPGGTEVSVLGRATDGVWFFVAGNFGQGWVNVEFTLFRGDYGSVPVIEDIASALGTITSQASGQGGGEVTSTSFAGSEYPLQGIVLLGSDLRSEPSDNAPNVRSALPADPNTVYPILNQTTVNQENWYFINVPGAGQGWVNKAEFRLLECGTNDVVVTSFPVTMIFDGISDDTPFTVESGTEGFARGFQGPFLLFEIFGVATGLIPSDAFENRNGVESLCGDAPIVNSAPANTTATTTQATTSNPTVVTNAGVTGNRVIVNTGNLNVRSGPSAGFAPVASVPGGTELAVLGRAPDGVWLLVSGSFGQGWVNVEFTLFRGNYSTVPIIEN